MGEHRVSADIWYEENAKIWSPKTKEAHTYYQLDYVYIYYQGKDYRINPIFKRRLGEHLRGLPLRAAAGDVQAPGRLRRLRRPAPPR